MTGHCVVAKLSALCVLTVGLAAFAVDPPHWSHTYNYGTATSTTQRIGCTTAGVDKGCHDGHNALGGTLTNAAANANLCQSCHAATLQAAGKPVASGDMASTTNSTGIHHAFGVACINAGLGTAVPGAALAPYVTGFGGQVVCSTCHDQHTGANKSGTQRLLTPQRILGTGTGTIAATATATASPKAYLIEIVAGGSSTTATFRISNDNGVSWWGWTNPNWVAYAANPRTANTTPVALNDGANLSISFTGGAGTFVANDRYYLYVSYPFLRAVMDSGDNTTGAKFCRDCHGAWTMDHTNLEDGDGTKVMGHPVGIVLNANTRGYDRAAPLDGNGQAQAGDKDGNPSNDLKLDSGNRIQCYTCHGLHYADSNTTTVDGP